MMCDMRFEDRVLFVTGGASGIGLATARRVVAEGGRAALVDLDLAKAEAAATELPGCIGLAANVADEAAVEAAVAATVERLGGIDLVVAAAGHAAFPRGAPTAPRRGGFPAAEPEGAGTAPGGAAPRTRP